MTTEIVNVENVSKRFVLHQHRSVKERVVDFRGRNRHRHDFWALRDIDLSVPLGSTVGLVGHNGSGKSTLLKVIGGIIEPTTGTVTRRGRMAALLELGAGFHPDLTGRENVYVNASILGLTRKETDRYFDDIVEFSGIEEFIDTQVKFYSSGMYVRLAFAVAVHVDPDLLLVDEVLAVGDEPFQKKCMDKIASFQREGRTIVLVSHSASQVGALCDRVIVMDHGKMVFDGEPATGIRILRDGYESDRMAEAAAALQAGDETEVTFTEVDISSQVHASGVDVVLDLEVEVKDQIDDWGLGVTLENTLGTVVYAVDTFGEKLDMPASVGKHRVRLELPDLRLGAGKYLVHLGLGSSSGLTYASRSGAGSFNAPDELHGSGLLRVDPAFHIGSPR